MPPETRYATSGDVNIAYQVVGDGPSDLVFLPGFVSHLDLQRADPRIARFLEKLASFLTADPVRQAWDRPSRRWAMAFWPRSMAPHAGSAALGPQRTQCELSA